MLSVVAVAVRRWLVVIRQACDLLDATARHVAVAPVPVSSPTAGPQGGAAEGGRVQEALLVGGRAAAPGMIAVA